ncbi:CheR family methyltransferase [Natrononativus amylolyticus]|uniref:CheR family methyltransferase n=1 Tax=Natrononativus amylolyticus TaxID=2963434 RepID=UPI0020CCC566|nr:protein-glutamate O-methyltransferase CheR [Natrononativus amylolyticus]
MSTAAFDSLLAYVEDELGFATSHYNDSYLDRRIASRMRRTGTDCYETYFDTLRSQPAEQEALLESMSINVTGFFRNPEVWDGLRSVLRTLAAENERVHVWSAACADGREPYSLSMLAHADPRIDESSVHVLATDISEPALETARRGVYEESRTVDIASQLEYLPNYRAYVDREGPYYRVADTVKRRVTFERHDLINDEPKAGFDLVVCRNLFIYIDTEYKQSMLETLSRSLRPTGFLVIGKAETLPSALKSTFDVHRSRLRIYRRTVEASVPRR